MTGSSQYTPGKYLYGNLISENLGDFDKQLKKDEIPHLFSYQHCPKINAFIERYNRTVQEEFIDNHLDTIHDKVLFHRELADYLIFYNTKRVHKSLGKKTPIDYLIEQEGVLSQMCLTYTFLLTKRKSFDTVDSWSTQNYRDVHLFWIDSYKTV